MFLPWLIEEIPILLFPDSTGAPPKMNEYNLEFLQWSLN